MQNTSGGVQSVHHLLDSKVEAIELKVTEETRNHGVPLKDLHLKSNILLACINRMDQVIIPGGQDAMQPGDTVVVVSLAGRIIVDLNDIFQES
jgi:trk system potassium uptake protein TrkA